MSVLIQKPENTAAIADFIANILNHRTTWNSEDYYGISLNIDRLQIAFKDCYSFGLYEAELIYKTLVNRNYESYNQRYGETDVNIVPYKENVIARRSCYIYPSDDETGKTKQGHFKIEKWHFQMYKMIQFYDYQCELNDYVKIALAELKIALCKHIVENSKTYNCLDWE